MATNTDNETESPLLAHALSQPPLIMSPQRKFSQVPTAATIATIQESMLPQTPSMLPFDFGLSPIIQNVVSTVSVDCPLDLLKINSRTRNSDYNPKKFCGLVMRIREPRATALVFSSGKVVVTGVRHESHAVLASRKFACIFQKLGFPVKFKGFKIHNMVATCDLRFPIKLEQLNQVHGQFSSYEPELFPALIYRLVKPRIVLLIFVNGKIVVTGAKTREEIQDGLENMLPILRSFRKQ